MNGVFVTATGTDVGKTVVSAALLLWLRERGIEAGYFKPVATGGGLSGIGEDESFVRRMVGFSDGLGCGTGLLFEAPLSPHLASRRERRAIILSELDEGASRAFSESGFVVVEGAGGLAVPLDERGTLVADLPLRWGLPCVLVADAGLGTINHTVLAATFARVRGLQILGIVLNQGTNAENESDNALQIARLTGIPVFGILPRLEKMERDVLGRLAASIFEPFVYALLPACEKRIQCK